MSGDLSTLAETINSQAASLEEFKRSQAEKLERLEIRMSRPGAFHQQIQQPASHGGLIDTRTGRTLVEIKRGDDIRARYAEAGFIQDDELRDLKMGDLVRGIAGQKTSDLARKALSVGTDASGGHMVPTVLMPGILQALTANSSLLEAGARIVPVDALADGAKNYTIAAVNAVPTAAWRAEAGNVAESDPTFRAVVATPRSLAFFFKVSRELLADAANLERVLPVVIGQSMARAMDRAGLMGSGTAPEPRGIKNLSGIQTVTNGTNGASLASFANLMAATRAILNVDGPMPTAAIMAPRTLVGFGSLVDSTGQPLERPPILRDLQMISTSQIATNLTVGSSTDATDIYMGDFSRCAFVMREAVSIQRLNELFAGTGEVGFVCHARVDFIAEYPTTLALISGVRP